MLAVQVSRCMICGETLYGNINEAYIQIIWNNKLKIGGLCECCGYIVLCDIINIKLKKEIDYW